MIAAQTCPSLKRFDAFRFFRLTMCYCSRLVVFRHHCVSCPEVPASLLAFLLSGDRSYGLSLLFLTLRKPTVFCTFLMQLRTTSLLESILSPSTMPATKSSGTPSAGDRQVVSAALCALCARTTLSILTQLNTERSLAPWEALVSTFNCRLSTSHGGRLHNWKRGGTK